jgi:hypothetical protein
LKNLQFLISDKEDTRIKKFIKRQDKKRKKGPKGQLTGRYEYIFTPNEIGTAVTIHDTWTGERKDVTDLDCW